MRKRKVQSLSSLLLRRGLVSDTLHLHSVLLLDRKEHQLHQMVRLVLGVEHRILKFSGYVERPCVVDPSELVELDPPPVILFE